MIHDKCLLYREIFPHDHKETGAMALEHSNKGRAWAQMQMQIGRWHWSEAGKAYGFALNKKEGNEVDQKSCIPALSGGVVLGGGRLYSEEINDSDKLKLKDLLKEAADLGLGHNQTHNKIWLICVVSGTATTKRLFITHHTCSE